MPDQETAEFRPAREGGSSSASWIAAAVLACAVATGAAWWFWLRPVEPPPAAPPPVASVPDEPAAAPPPMPEASGPQNPVDALAPPDAALPALAESDARVAEWLAELLGRDKVAAFLLTDGFVRRAVATVDNLARAQAPARMWPVQPMPQRFTVEGEEGGVQTIAPANATRYGAFVSFAEAVPLDGAVRLYARLYPLFQTAYEELGFPRRYFNDRLVAVLDHLLAAPEPGGPLQVRLTKVVGEVPSTQPWVRYEFADPALEALSSGQKMLVRMGPENARRLKAVLAELRRRVATGGVVPQKE